MAKRSKLPTVPGDDNRTFTRLTRVEDRVADVERRVSEHDAELHEVNLDIATLADVVLRSQKRHRARLTALSRIRRSRRDASTDR